MQLEKYRRHVVNSWSIKKYWDKIILYVAPNDRIHRPNLYPILQSCGENHPQVNSGNAYWTTDTTLCLGYTLKSNNTIFRPIFSYKRQELINKFQDKISEIVLKRNESMKNKAKIELYKIKKLPEDVLYHIFEMV